LLADVAKCTGAQRSPYIDEFGMHAENKYFRRFILPKKLTEHLELRRVE